MIGNDIVDLEYMSRTSNWRRPRFLEKLFTPNELEYIVTSEKQDLCVWLLWSMKEAAYKIHVQQIKHRFFNPKRLECHLISEEKGHVSIDNTTYETNSIITHSYIYTIAKTNASYQVKSSVFKNKNSLYNVQSNQLKQCLLKSISDYKKVNLEALSLQKTTFGVPELYLKSEPFYMSISLTHCGRFSGFAY